MSNPVHRVLEAIGVPYGAGPKQPNRGVAKRRKLRKIARASRRYNLRAK